MVKKAVLFFISIISFSASNFGQTGQMGGVSTGEAKNYTSKRTVGIVDEKAPRVFEDVTAQTVLKDFRCVSGGKAKEYILETTACTVAVFDYDNDGKPDIYLLNGSTMNAELGREKAPKSALYRNLGNWKFEDVTEKAGVANERWGMGAAIGDYDNDGFSDIFVGNYGTSRLYKNNRNGTFTDVAAKVGLDIKGWHTGATFGDYDKDGRLDIFIPAYLEFDLKNLPPSPLATEKQNGGKNPCQFRGQPVMCGPRGLKGAKDRLFHQKADGTFEEVGDKIGVRDEGDLYGFASVFIDVDDDKDLDLLVVNDSTPKQLYLNNGSGAFEEIGYPSGIALNENGREQAGMGLAVGDYDNDGRVDFYITNFSDDSNTLYRNDGDANFTDITFQAGLGEPTIPFLGWGTSFLDYDNDGWKDVVVANGHVYPAVDDFQWGTSFAQQILLFQNTKPATKNNQIRYERIAAAPNSGLAKAFTARGIAAADFDGDGRLDLIVNNLDSAPALLRNVAEAKGNWLALKLVGDSSKKTPKDAVGSTVYATTGKLRQRFDVTSGAGYASQNDQTIHIGLGGAVKIDSLEIIWANGETQKIAVDKINRMMTIKQSDTAKTQK
ncbi:MAG: CRTAC1 family protein [Acidobacteriota bacterium]|nr:CRTAC1 family protein [Acidobacteriota bacterium]